MTTTNSGLSGQMLYDMIMSQIEPELTTSAIPTLEQKYKTESATAKEARLARYQKAFENFDAVSTRFIAEFLAHVGAYKRKAFRSAEEKARAEEGAQLQEMETAFSSLPV